LTDSWKGTPDHEDHPPVTTDHSVLPQWKGHPVPWVARWSGEEKRIRPRVDKDPTGHLWVSYPDDGTGETREPSGVLWQKEGITRAGEPRFAHVSTYRQRSAMRHRLCQVCGRKVQDGMITWVMGASQFEILEDGTAVSMSPPVCDECIPLCLELCPHLREPENRLVLKVLEYRIWGVSGEVFMLDHNRNVARHANVIVDYDTFTGDLTGVLAKQQVVQFTKFAKEEL
jgi:hypothetical protein